MQILEAEINLREETRVAEQARAGLEAAEHAAQAKALAATQDELRGRVEALTGKMGELPHAEDFGKEIALLRSVEEVMREAAGILSTPDTGPPAIAAETEVIELLLATKRMSCKGGGGGGGSTPGGGGADDPPEGPALALIGVGANEKARPEQREVEQTSGEAGRILPEEFRAGLDEYFNRLERRSLPALGDPDN
ncbi:MAG TPA: hypothetical protein VGX78_10440 [Pirellulales bacterium]|jgi:hypothetical protein|nr:hypothetical protein [Pirellulales bacterium]